MKFLHYSRGLYLAKISNCAGSCRDPRGALVHSSLKGSDKTPIARWLITTGARGSALESIGHLAKAAGKSFISSEENRTLSNRYTEISKMLTPWINYLQRCNWKSRGIRPDDLPEGTG